MIIHVGQGHAVQIERDGLGRGDGDIFGHVVHQLDGIAGVGFVDGGGEGGVLLCPDHSDRILFRLHPMTLRNLHKHFVGVLVNNIAVSSTGGNDLVANDHKTVCADLFTAEDAVFGLLGACIFLRQEILACGSSSVNGDLTDIRRAD